ncbi:unnamed protein product [Ophioblennius macclurei]
MIKAMSFSSAVRTPCVFTWVSIFCVISAVGLAVGQAVQIQTLPQVAAECGQNVSLTCDATYSQSLNIKSFSWVRDGKNGPVCKYEPNQTKQAPGCETKMIGAYHHRLILTLVDLKPNDAGKYICKFHSSQGAKSNKTYVEVQECRGNLTRFMNQSHGECSFKGVYPSGVVHWSQGDVNLTDSCSTSQELDQHGRFDILSVIDVSKGNLSQPYTCSLWVPALNRYQSWMQLLLSEELNSSGIDVGGMWICIVMEIVVLKLIM